jgi:hypothetical protein
MDNPPMDEGLHLLEKNSLGQKQLAYVLSYNVWPICHS